MLIVISCSLIYALIVGNQFNKAGILFKKKNRKPRKSHYMVGKYGNLYKKEYNQRFKITLSDEFWY